MQKYRRLLISCQSSRHVRQWKSTGAIRQRGSPLWFMHRILFHCVILRQTLEAEKYLYQRRVACSIGKRTPVTFTAEQTKQMNITHARTAGRKFWRRHMTYTVFCRADDTAAVTPVDFCWRHEIAGDMGRETDDNLLFSWMRCCIDYVDVKMVGWPQIAWQFQTSIRFPAVKKGFMQE
jgi:hypothetical protein